MNLISHETIIPQLTAVTRYFDYLTWSWSGAILCSLLGYPALTRLLRFQRLGQIQKRFNYATRELLANMTDDEALTLIKSIAELEFPYIFGTSLGFALFRTYGIPTISETLVNTNELSSHERAAKRYADTGALINEFVRHAPSDSRSIESIARMNYLHQGYRKSGKIRDDDMLYTLALFATQPIKWIDTYEWRPLSDLERNAIGVFWKRIGEAMLISYDRLPSSKTDFTDGILWLDEITSWSEAYEAENMIPAVSNKNTADPTLEILVYSLPNFLKPVGHQVITALMDERLRKSIMYPPASTCVQTLVLGALKCRKYILRYLALPRPYLFRVNPISEKPTTEGRYYFTLWDGPPYYVQPTFWNRWGPTAWWSRALGHPVPGDEPEKHYSQGYFLPDVGPRKFECKGHIEMQKTKEQLQKNHPSQCPL